VELRLSASVDYARFDTGEFDADIIYGHPRLEGLVVLPLREETVTPLCAPHVAEGIESPADLLRHQLIQSDNKQVRWPAWFAVNGMAVPSILRGSRFDRSFLAIAAAAEGLGIALVSTLLAARESARARLVAPLAGRSQDIRYVGHHLIYPPPAERRAPLRAFALWLARELNITFTHFC
jgi:DNA-binding transcriptional LysR family regulator